METAIGTAAEVANHLNAHQVISFLLVVVVLVLLSMVRRAWNCQFTVPAVAEVRRRRKRRTRRSNRTRLLPPAQAERAERGPLR